MKRSLTVITTLLLAAWTVSARAAEPLSEVAVTTCGQIVPKMTLGYLTGDLDCTGYNGGDPAILIDTDVPVTLGRKAKLDLRGFTLTGGKYTVECINIRAEARRHMCEIFNGTLVGADQSSVLATDAYVHDVTSTGTGVGLYLGGRHSRVENVVVTGNFDDGLRIGNAKVRNATITNNGGNGIVGGKLKIADSTITGNGINAYCTANPGNCFDVSAYKEPKVENLVCGTSGGARNGTPPTWGICSSD